MSDTTRQVIEQALRLPVKERAEIAAELLASIDGEGDADAEAAWAAEIERRARRAIAGDSKGTDWQVVRGRLRAKVRRS